MNCFDSRFTLKGTGAVYAPDRTFDTEHIRLDLKLDVNREKIGGLCTTRLRAITGAARSMVFDAVNFKIFSVKLSGRKIAFDYKDGRLSIEWDKPVAEGKQITVEISYEVVKPKLGLYFIKPNRSYPKRPTQVWSQGEDEYSRYWFPCHDAPHERTSTEVSVTVPSGFVAISNGKLLKHTVNKRNRTELYHWLQEIPHATYLVTLAVGRFAELQDKWRDVPVTYYCEKGREEETRRTFGKTPKMLEFFSTNIGVNYPYAKYAQVAATDFIYGGMENTSATTQTDTALLDKRVAIDYSSDELVAHELAHQWFGDYLTCKDWSHAWLNESFATYFDPLFKRFDKGEEEFLYHLKGNQDAYFQEDKEHYRRPIVTKSFKRPTDLFDRHLYEKGSIVLHMLHRQLGEKLWWKSIKNYVRTNKGRVVETLDLVNAIEEATGRNMRRFFDQWVYGAGHPEFKIRSWWDARKKEINLRLVQTHGTNSEVGLFHVPTEFLFLTKKGEKRFPVVIEKKSHLFTFKLDDNPSLILFDPSHAVLKRVDFPKSEAMLLVQLAKDKHILGRIDAAHKLARGGGRKALDALRAALLKEDFWGVRVDVAQAIGSMKTEAASGVLLEALKKISHPKVRRAIYNGLGSFPTKAAAAEVEKSFHSEESVLAEAAALRTIGMLNSPRAGGILNEALKKNSWNDLLRSSAVEGLAATGSREWVDLLLNKTKPGHHQRLRMAAIRCLPSIGAGMDAVQNRLIELVNDDFLLVQITAVRALHQIGDERAVPALKKITTGDLDGRLKRLAEEAVEKITKGFE